MNKKLIKLLIFLVLAAGIALAIVYRQQFDAASLQSWVNDAGIAGPVVFMLIYIVGTVFFFPGSVLTLAGGALFGPLLGTFYNLTAATTGAIISFIAARYLAHDWVEQKTGGRLKSLKQGVETEGWKFVAFVRLVPLFPFNLLNYALGLTKIKLSHYSIATYICMLPGAIAYTYIGYVGREALAGDEAVIQKVMIGIALLAIVSFLPGIIGKFRAKPMMDVTELKKKLDAGEDMLLLDVRAESDFYGEQGHIEGALLMPLEELANSLEVLKGFQQKKVMTICRTDRRSAKAAQILNKNGFTDVQVIKQGMTDWNKKGYPLGL
ncbi:MAG: VTT domain-containing protein [Gammaproteobacteria bacterium]|nr:VTT domain-containing protein [Gammaproteobacteria bacterium]